MHVYVYIYVHINTYIYASLYSKHIKNRKISMNLALEKLVLHTYLFI